MKFWAYLLIQLLDEGPWKIRHLYIRIRICIHTQRQYIHIVCVCERERHRKRERVAVYNLAHQRLSWLQDCVLFPSKDLFIFMVLGHEVNDHREMKLEFWKIRKFVRPSIVFLQPKTIFQEKEKPSFNG